MLALATTQQTQKAVSKRHTKKETKTTFRRRRPTRRTALEAPGGAGAEADAGAGPHAAGPASSKAAFVPLLRAAGDTWAVLSRFAHHLRRYPPSSCRPSPTASSDSTSAPRLMPGMVEGKVKVKGPRRGTPPVPSLPPMGRQRAGG